MGLVSGPLLLSSYQVCSFWQISRGHGQDGVPFHKHNWVVCKGEPGRQVRHLSGGPVPALITTAFLELGHQP